MCGLRRGFDSIRNFVQEAVDESVPSLIRSNQESPFWGALGTAAPDPLVPSESRHRRGHGGATSRAKESDAPGPGSYPEEQRIGP